MPTRVIIACVLIAAMVALAVFMLVRTRLKAKSTRRENARPIPIKVRDD